MGYGSNCILVWVLLMIVAVVLIGFELFAAGLFVIIMGTVGVMLALYIGTYR